MFLQNDYFYTNLLFGELLRPIADQKDYHTDYVDNIADFLLFKHLLPLVESNFRHIESVI